MRKKLLLLLITVPSMAMAQLVSHDPKTTQQVIQNTASAQAKELVIDKSVDEHRSLQDKCNAIMTVINTSKTMYFLSLKNVDHFGNDNENIKEIALLSKRIAVELVETSKQLMKNPKTTIVSWTTIQGLTEEAVGSLQYVYSLVSNGKVRLNIPGLPAISSSKDGENLLDPTTRLDICNKLIGSLRRIYNILVQMKYQCMFTTDWGMIFREALPFESFIIFNSKDIVDGIVKDFNKLK